MMFGGFRLSKKNVLRFNLQYLLEKGERISSKDVRYVDRNNDSKTCFGSVITNTANPEVISFITFPTHFLLSIASLCITESPN